MALPKSTCDPIDDPECAAGWEVLANFLDVLVNDARTYIPAECVGAGEEGLLTGFITLSDQINVSNTISMIVDSFARKGPVSPFLVNTRVVLLEPGWPVPEVRDGIIELPSLGELTVAATHSMAHAERLYRKIRNLKAGANTYQIEAIGEQMTPIDMTGPYAAWEVDVDFRIPTVTSVEV